MRGPASARFGLLEATALNMSNMVGIGPFITIPLLMSALGGPISMFGWLIAVIIAIADGLVWSELGASLPGSGGSYRFLKEGLGRWGQLGAFLFVWQFMLSAPLEIASGYIGMANYLRYIVPVPTAAVAIVAGLLNIALLYRPVQSLGRITIVLWVGTLITSLWVIVTGAIHFDASIAFPKVDNPLGFSVGFLLGLGTATRIGVYDYLGYYDVCYLGDEVRDPGRTIPRAVLLSIVLVALLYIGINLSIIGSIPLSEFVPAETTRAVSDYVASVLMERAWGRTAAIVFTGLVVWTAFGSVFALLLGYSRVPYAAAREGDFFSAFATLHPRAFPHRSLVLLGGAAILASFAPLGLVIDALITSRILVQFVGQIIALTVLRRQRPELVRPFRMWFYPLPSLVALVGWIFLFATSDLRAIGIGLGMTVFGAIVYWIKNAPMRRSARYLPS